MRVSILYLTSLTFTPCTIGLLLFGRFLDALIVGETGFVLMLLEMLLLISTEE